jgi:hypothetical protein
MGHDYFRGDGSSPLFLGLRAKSHPISATAAQRNYPSGANDGLRLAMTRPEHSRPPKAVVGISMFTGTIVGHGFISRPLISP